jgi:RNA polymerase sigma factor (sigma-70 family)
MSLTDLSPLAACDTDDDGLARGRRDGLAQDMRSEGGLETLYRDHGSRLRRLLARRVGRDEAADLVQEAFAKLAAILSLARAPIAKPEAFVTTVATNILRDRARAAARNALREHELVPAALAQAADPHQIAEGREALRAIERALGVMNPRRRRIFLLHRQERLTYAEIGRMVGMSEKGVKKQMAKALVELRCALDRPA